MAKLWHVEDAERFVGAHAYDLSQADQVLNNLRCVDCREHRQLNDTGNRLPAIAIPGAGLGLFMDVLAAFECAVRSGQSCCPVSPAAVHEAVVSVVGTVTLHTDDAALARGDMLCGGCVYCGSSLRDPEKFLLSPEIVRFFLDEYFSHLTAEFAQRGEQIVSYSGVPSAQAVFVVDGDDIGLPSRAGEAQAYVYHRSWHHRCLRQVAVTLYPLVRKAAGHLSEEQWYSYVSEVSAVRLSHAIGYVAHKLPKFRVYRTTSKAILVESINIVTDSPVAGHERQPFIAV